MIRSRALVWLCVPLVVLAVLASFYRFIVVKDYVADYQVACDPETQDCFAFCDQDSCEETDPYLHASKNANDLYAQCGPDITDCSSASVCLLTDRDCVIQSCSEDLLMEGEFCTKKAESVQETP